jgi:hypothetical protein
MVTESFFERSTYPELLHKDGLTYYSVCQKSLPNRLALLDEPSGTRWSIGHYFWHWLYVVLRRLAHELGQINLLIF